jgi:hypothetical protein
MRLMTMTRLLCVSVVLLGGTPAFAAPAVHPNTLVTSHEQRTGFGRRSPFNLAIPSAIDDPQAAANAASKIWPGDMLNN